MYDDNVASDVLDNVPSPGFAGQTIALYPGICWTMYDDNVASDVLDNVPSPGFAGQTIALYPGICWVIYQSMEVCLGV